jgi:hypothetical protein
MRLIPQLFVLTVHDIFKEHFVDRWIGCGSPKSPVPLSWPPHSPHRTTPNNTSWGNINEQVALHYYVNNELWNRLLPFHCEYFGACHTEHGSASGYVRNMAAHTQIHLMYSNCHQSVKSSEGTEDHSDFLVTLYICNLHN